MSYKKNFSPLSLLVKVSLRLKLITSNPFNFNKNNKEFKD